MSRSISIAHTHTQNERIQIKNDPTSHRADSASRVSKKMRKYRRGEERIQLNLGKSSSLRLQRADKWPLPNTWYARPGRVPFTEKKNKTKQQQQPLNRPDLEQVNLIWPLLAPLVFCFTTSRATQTALFFSLSLSLSLSFENFSQVRGFFFLFTLFFFWWQRLVSYLLLDPTFYFESPDCLCVCVCVYVSCFSY